MPVSALASVRQRRFPLTAWPWRSAGYLVTTVPVAMGVGIPLLILGFPWALLLRRLSTGDAGPLDSLLLLLVGAGLVAGLGPLVAAPVAVVERLRLRLVDDRPLAPGRVVFSGDAVRRLRHRLGGRVGWREFAYAVVLVTAVPVLYGALAVTLMLILVCAGAPALVSDGPISLGVVTITTARQAIPFSVAGTGALFAVPYLLALVAGAHGAAARALLTTAPDAALRAELVEVSRSRARLVDAFEAERRRIERDLHDGAQQKLVGLTLQLGLARLDLPPATPAASAVATAHDQAKQLMAELRELIHGIRPQVLTELGLPAALRELARGAPVPVTVRAELPRRPPGHVEATGYFVVAEALTNVAKHGGATCATVTAHLDNATLVVEVADDGRGGADPSGGSGLTGLADRVAVMDGRMLLSSPAGGPTILRVELPCP
ncbi:sensor histidine kinase [Virgisporangium aurantiacum]|uniref:histidine kinase n=1 Tax=Virgisporangium aurantiacum TaxID=175570 RepID=A0A8J3Z3V2_9ACTN|nr:histidine kinase [Virgisporangium aurantiacum]GIJ54500.1 histidine kinase [Virgisporangium aurantiacum]